MNDPGDDGEDRGEEDDMPNPGGKDPNDASSNSDDDFQFKSNESPENPHEIQEGGQMWEHNVQTRATPDEQIQTQPIQMQGSVNIMGNEGQELQDDGEDRPSCNGEDFQEGHTPEERKSEREDTEIDFIQQVDTDRQANQEDDVDLALPVNNENQIQITSKHQIDINDQILNQQKAQLDKLSQISGSRKRAKQSEKTKHANHSEHLYTEVFVWGSDLCG